MVEGDGALSVAERYEVLRSLASQEVGNVVCLDASFGRCPMPEVIERIGFDFEPVISSDSSSADLFDALSAADRARLLGALDESRRTGVGAARVQFVSSDRLAVREGPTGLCIVDLVDDAGVYVFVAGELLDVGEDIVRADELLRPRRLVMHRDETANFVGIDPLTEALLGWTEADLLGTSALDLVHPDDRDRGIESWLEMLAGSRSSRYRLRFRTVDGSYRWMEISNVDRLEEEGWVVTEMVDVDDEMSALARVRAGERQFTTLTESLPVGVVQVDAEGNLVFANEWIRQIVGSPEIERTRRADLGSLDPDDRRPLVQTFRNAILDGADGDLDVRVLGAEDGLPRLCRVRVRPLVADDGVVGAIASVEDITESVSLQRQLRRQAETDHLTDLPNRAALGAHLQRMLDERSRDDATTRLALLFVDLDGFKLVNDALGHDAGDELLVEVGRRLSESIRADDFVARVGGDEFVVVCPSCRSEVDAEALASRIVDQLGRRFDVAGSDASISASVGIALLAESGMTADVLIGNADLAMYEAKRAGGGRWMHYARELRQSMAARFDVQRRIDTALDRDEFELHLQPIFDLRTGSVVAAETLVRWNHPDRGLVGPGEFVPVAEESDLMVPLGRWILDEACRLAARAVARHGPEFRVAVNVSGRQLAHGAFPAEVAAALDRHDLAPRNLVLEVTETVFVDTDGTAVDDLRTIVARGTALALDDFGTGYSSLNHLRVMPVTMLKIDSSYVADLGADPGTTAIVAAVTDLAERLGLDLVAEGVETPEHLARVVELGVTFAQGFHLGRPVPESTFFAPSATGRALADDR